MAPTWSLTIKELGMIGKSFAFAAFLAMAGAGAGANATVIDFTDARTGTTGTIHGGTVSWHLTSIDDGEFFELSFSAPTKINAASFLGLFTNSKDHSAEYGKVTVDGKAVFTADATEAYRPGRTGLASVAFAPIYASLVRFESFIRRGSLDLADGVLGSVSIAPVPVPAAGGLLLAGLGGIAALRRRKKG
jgi:hypothetical protein